MIEIEMVNAKEVAESLGKIDMQQVILEASEEVSELILDTKGIRIYPNETQANSPYGRKAYYIRGVGQYSPARGGSYRLVSKSENYGKSFTVAKNPYGFRISNSASYSSFLGGDNQVSWAGRRGWRRLSDVAKEKSAEINKIFNHFIELMIRKVGL